MIITLHFLDFESFKNLWTCVIIDPARRKKTVIVNDKSQLEDYYNQYKNEIFIGYNIRGYDQYIFKGILCDFDPYEITKWIIEDKKQGYQFSNLFRNFPLIFYEVGSKTIGLKQLEGFMGNDIRETTIPFSYDGEFTPKMIDEVIYYNTHDVEQTIEVFLQKKSEFDAMMGLIKIFKLPLHYISKTMAQLTAIICGGKKLSNVPDEFNFPLVEATKYIKKYKHVVDWYKNPLNHDYKKSITATVGGVKCGFAWGGGHGAIPQYIEEGIFILADVTAYYPSIQKEYQFGKQSMSNWDNFLKIHNENLRFKKLGNKKARLPYKIGDNAISGQLKDKTSSLYYPSMNNAVTVNGQLMLLLLMEMVEPYSQLIQFNTDGILIKIDSWDVFDKIDDLVYEWECLSGMRMEFTNYKKVIQKDVNNYIAVEFNGKVKRKGAYVKELNPIDNDLPIVNEALVNYMTKNIPIEETINKCDDLIKFQKIVRIQGNYLCGWHNKKKLTDKTFRVFASNDWNDTYVGKQKREGATIEKFGNTPEHCFIDNTDVKEKKVPDKLDRCWYINLAKKRLEDYGVI